MVGQRDVPHHLLHAAAEAADARLLEERARHRQEVEKLEARAAQAQEEAAVQVLPSVPAHAAACITCLAACACELYHASTG